MLDDAFLKGTGTRAEGVADQEEGDDPPDSPEASAASDPVTPALYVSPTSGQLSPGEESRIRLTFTPKRAGALSFALPVWLAREPERDTRPYMTLLVKVTPFTEEDTYSIHNQTCLVLTVEFIVFSVFFLWVLICMLSP